MNHDARLERFVLPVIFGLIMPVAVAANKAMVLLLALAAICVIPTAVRSGRHQILRSRPSTISVLYALFLGWGLLSALWSIDPHTTFTRFGRLAGISILGAIVLYEITRTGAATKRRILEGCAIGLVGALALIVAKYVWIREIGDTTIYPEGFDPLSVFNPALTVLAILIWPIAVRLAGRSSWLVAMAVLAIYALFLAFSTSQASVLALIIGAVGFGAAVAWPRATPRIAAALLCVTILSAPFVTLRITGDPAMMEMLQPLPGSARHRAYIWEFAANHILQRPILGWGLDASRSIPGGKERPPVGYEYMPLHPHNAALQVWLELGAVGALLAGLMTAFVTVKVGRAMPDRLCAGAATASILSFAVIAFTAYGVFQSWWFAFAWLMAAVLAALRTSGAAPRTSP